IPFRISLKLERGSHQVGTSPRAPFSDGPAPVVAGSMLVVRVAGARHQFKSSRLAKSLKNKFSVSLSPDGTCYIRAHIMSITLKRFLADEQGATAIEYGLIAAGISIAIVAVVQGVGSN